MQFFLRRVYSCAQLTQLFLSTDSFEFVQMLDFDGGFAFSICLSNLPGTEGSSFFLYFSMLLKHCSR